MKKLAIICVLGLALASSCKKDSSSNDTVTTQTIHGQVYNLCTDSGLANCTVFLNINNSTGGGSTLQTISGANGMFSFANVQIHSNSDYTYDLEVQDNTAGGYQPDIDGNDVGIDKSKISQTWMIPVIPIADYWRLYFPSSITSAIYSDTFTLVLQQNILHKNVPSINYSMTLAVCPCPTPTPTAWAPINNIGNISGYWMGMWYSTLNKTHNGVHTITRDSFYIPWVPPHLSIADTIPW